MGKKIIQFMVAFIGILLIAALVIPFLVDMNKFKPQIQGIVEDAVHANIEFDSARLTIITGLGIELSNVKITNSAPPFKGITLFQVDSVVLRLALSPLLKGNFEGEIKISNPEIAFVTEGVHNNFASLPRKSVPNPEDLKNLDEKPSGEKTAKNEDSRSQKYQHKKISEREKLIEDFKRRVLIRSVQIENAIFVIRSNGDIQHMPGVSSTRITDLNIVISDIGLEQDIKTSITTKISFKSGKTSVTGPVDLSFRIHPSTVGSDFKSAAYQGKMNFDQLSINVNQAFIKKRGIPLNIKFAGKVTPDSFNLSNLSFNLHKIAIRSVAKISDFKALNAKANLHFENKDLKSLGDILPQHKALLIGGSASLDAHLSGSLSNLAQVKAGLKFSANLSGSDLSLNVRVENAAAPIAQLAMRSTQLDLDSLLAPFLNLEDDEKSVKSTTKPVKTTQIAQNSNSQVTDTSAENPKDFSLSASQKSLLKDSNITTSIDFQSIRFQRVDISKLILKFKQRGLILDLSKFSFGVFDGNIHGRGKINLHEEPISFDTGFGLTAIETSKIIELLAEEHKDVLHGKADFDLKLHGQGTTESALSKTLNGIGSFKFLDGEVKGESIASQAGHQLDSFAKNLSILTPAKKIFAQAERVLQNPLLAKFADAKKFNLNRYKKRYEQSNSMKLSGFLGDGGNKNLENTKGELEIRDGRIYITSKKSSDSGSFEMKSSVGLDMSLDGGGTFMGSEKTKQLMKSKSKYASLLFDHNNDFSFGFTTTGTVSNPTVKADLSRMKESFNTNAKALVKQELDLEIQRLKNGLLGGKVAEAKARAKALIAQKKAALNKRRLEAKNRFDLEKKRKMAALTKKKAELRKKLEDRKRRERAKAKSRLKNKLKGKIPGF